MATPRWRRSARTLTVQSMFEAGAGQTITIEVEDGSIWEQMLGFG
jgi:hypothetical protein